jgi:hypothetical protein
MDIVCGICGRHFRDAEEAKSHSQEHKCSDNIPVKLTTSDNNMSKEDRDYWKAGYDEGHHLPICTCAECNEIRNQRIKEQNKIIEERNKAGGFTLEEQGNENQEYPRQEVPRWQNQEPRMNIPSFSPPENEYGMPQQRSNKLGGGIGTIVITVIISLVLCYAMVSLLGISPSMKQYKADITRLELDLVDVRAVDAATNAELDGLQNASIIAQNASTTATEAKNAVATLQTNYTSLNASLTALDNRIADLESNSGDIYDDTIIRGLITAVEEDITAINTTITALQAYDTTNTTNLAALQTQIDDLADDLAAIQGDEGDTSSILSLQTEINAIKKFLNDADTVVGSLKYQLAVISGDIQALYAQDVTLQNSIDDIALEDASITYYSMSYIDIKINKTGNYAIILTIYGNKVDLITPYREQTNYKIANDIFEANYGNPLTMKTIIITPQDITIGSETSALEGWTKGQTYKMSFSTVAPATIACIDIDTADRY